MQYNALENKSPISAEAAKKNILYSCPECHQILNLQNALYAPPYFYHIKKNPECRQYKKSPIHLQIQKTISQLLPLSESTLETPLYSINRIADIVWEKGKIIFEIECSSLSVEEVKKRYYDYESLGFLPIWILHDSQYNRKKLSDAEYFLRSKYCYFTNINEKGEGEIYDQEDLCRGCERVYKGSKVLIDLQNPCLLQKNNLPLVEKKKFSLLRIYKIFLHLLLESI